MRCTGTRRRRTLPSPRTKTTSRTKFTWKIKGNATNKKNLMKTIKEKTSPTRSSRKLSWPRGVLRRRRPSIGCHVVLELQKEKGRANRQDHRVLP
jgi:hypothetical protein